MDAITMQSTEQAANILNKRYYVGDDLMIMTVSDSDVMVS